MGRRLLALLLFAMACATPVPKERAAVSRPSQRGGEHARASESAARAQQSQRTVLSLPFEGTWIVSQGYHGEESHRGYAAYALDFVALDAQGSAYVHRGERNQDWHGFGAQVLASADGVVVRAVDAFPDNRVMGKATDTNTVIIQHVEDELSEYVHLQRGSLRVQVGERVRRGQPIARCGNSGAETPHLHWAFLSSVDPIRTRPAKFSGYQVQGDDGAWRQGDGTLRSGERIQAADADSAPANQP